MTINIFVISNFNLMVEGISALIGMNPNQFRLAGTSASLDQAPDEIAKLHPDIVLLEIDGITSSSTLVFIEKLRTISDTKILLLTRQNNNPINDAAIALGANGVLGSTISSEQLFYACTKVIEGEIWLDRKTTGRVISQLSGKNRTRLLPQLQNDTANKLTDRELQVITILLKNDSPGKVVANELGISESTLRNKLSVIYEKLGVNNRQGLFLYARENGLI